MEILKYELKPEYDKAKSFYDKAYYLLYVNDKNLTIKKELYSYNTLVLTIEKDRYYLNYNIDEKLLFSSTTLRHIKEFIKQKGYSINDYIFKGNINKKDLIKYNNVSYHCFNKEYF